MTDDARGFAAAYTQARAIEGWADDDATVRTMPHVARRHQHARHWAVRAITAERLVQLLSPLPRPLRILDVGCGNGWLSALLARSTGAMVLGIDISEHEIEQARRVWSDVPQVTFSVGSIHSVATSIDPVDIVLFAASLQYAAHARQTLARALECTRTGGMVVVADTAWYTASTVDAARERSRRHYERIGVQSMIEHYFHHELSHLDGLDWRIVPISMASRCRWLVRYRAQPVFPLIQIMHT